MQNGTMMQYFHWYYPKDGSLWTRIKQEAPKLAEMGITAVWLPPASKSTQGNASVGYDVYDLYDLGEFDQKSSIPTKYGTKSQLLDAVKALHEANIQVYVDIVVNHMGGGDETETIQAIKVNENNRNEAISEPYDIEAYTKFTFPARKNKYSSFQWDHTCFSGVDYDHKTGERAIFNILNEYGTEWETMIGDEMGNYDYLMFCDIEFRNPAVRQAFKDWGKWFYETIGFDGMRLDAVKHIAPQFYNEWLVYMDEVAGKKLFAVGEYWAPGDLPSLEKYIDATEGKISLFDSALHHTFHTASRSGNEFDMTTIFNDTLVKANPLLAVSVVANHDTQPLQSLEAPIEPWFKPLAYALILLRTDGYPCVFYPDMYGAEYTDKGRDGNDYNIVMPAIECLPTLIKLRKEVAYGDEYDYFDHPNCIGWTRSGIEEMPDSGCAVVLSNGDAGFKTMTMGERFAYKTFVDALGNVTDEMVLDENGSANFSCAPGSVSVWIEKQ